MCEICKNCLYWFRDKPNSQYGICFNSDNQSIFLTMKHQSYCLVKNCFKKYVKPDSKIQRQISWNLWNENEFNQSY